MPKEIELDELRENLQRDGAQLIEVLPEAEYAEEHLPGAVSIPLKSLDAEAVADLDAQAPTVVYCWDQL